MTALDIAAPSIHWQTPSNTDERVAEIAALIERVANNVSCYAGGGSAAHRLREIASEIRVPNIVPFA